MVDVFSAINSPLGSTIGGGITLTPRQRADQEMEYQGYMMNSPLGQAAQRAHDKTVRFNKKIELDKAKAERDRIKILKGEAAADKWYKEQQIKILQMDHELKARTAEAEATGYWGGNPTLARQQMEANTTGYYNGNPTLAREQQAASLALQAGQLGASLRGPRNWATYLRTAYDTANSPVSSFVSSVPGGLGQGASQDTRRLTLTDVLNDYGVGSGRSAEGTPGTSMTAYSPNGVTAADLGLGGSDETTLRNYFNSPNQAPVGWWESKSEDQRQYLRGLAEEWGFSPDTIEQRYRNTRPNQGSAFSA